MSTFLEDGCKFLVTKTVLIFQSVFFFVLGKEFGSYGLCILENFDSFDMHWHGLGFEPSISHDIFCPNASTLKTEPDRCINGYKVFINLAIKMFPTMTFITYCTTL